jgi:hypothetical protein
MRKFSPKHEGKIPLSGFHDGGIILKYIFKKQDVRV